MCLKVQGLYGMAASGFRVGVTVLVFCFQVAISGPEPMTRVPTCIRKPKTNIIDESIKFLNWLLVLLFKMVLGHFRSKLDRFSSF